MKYDYVFLLSQGRTQLLKQFSFLLCLLSILAFIFFQWHAGGIVVFELVSILLVIVAMLFDYLRLNGKGRQEPEDGIRPFGFDSFNSKTSGTNSGQVIKRSKTPRFSLSLLVTGICWIGMPTLNSLCLAFFVLCVLEYLAGQAVQICLGSEIIISQGFLKRRYPWTQFNNVVLRDGLLTLDFKNNRLIQKETTNSDQQDEDRFNQYCQIKISEISG